MTEWTLLKRLLDAVHHHSTMIGRLWLTVMVIFRLLIVAVATEDVYTDEQEMFVCNTLQPGCSTVCYDAFAPISQPRFWVFHIISVSTPSLCFIIYTWHNLSKQPHNTPQRLGKGIENIHKKEGPDAVQISKQEAYNLSCDSDSCSIRSHKHLGHSLADVMQGITTQKSAVSGGVLSKCYVFHVCLRAVLEVGFVLAQWKLFGFKVPVHFLCTSSPCRQPVDCYVSRPTEKTIFLLFMFCVGVFCILLNLLELNHLGWKKIRQAVKLRQKAAWRSCPGMQRQYKPFLSDSPSLMSSFGFKEVTSTTSLPSLDLIVGHQHDWTCAANSDSLKEFVEVGETRQGKPKKHDSKKRERQLLKCKKEVEGSKQRSAEVWI
ncbi:gap junction delta-2 protein-like [Nematolebias whitei]|uniref:gap junction delta-2 protein-like n=1 Tax=Nematolebias whitei TaxID=451745 RepID=UPI001898065E|nr:gap junction delta-2 protein-like [Nematolebias whitei]